MKDLTQVNIPTIITRQELIIKTERLVRTDGLTYIEALLQISEDLDVDPEDLGKLVGGPLKDKVELDAMNKNFIPRTSNSFSLIDD
jgi:hypothetical protein